MNLHRRENPASDIIFTVTVYKRETVSFKFSNDSPQLPQGRRCYEWLPLRAPGQTGSAAWQRCESQDSGYTRTL